MIGMTLKYFNTYPIWIIGQPEAPVNLQVSDWDSDYMSLVWDPPPDDGGSPIQHYLMSVKVANARWEQLAQTERTKFTAKSLKSGQLYEFKVCAVSKGGVSKHSQATQPLVAKSRKEAPRMSNYIKMQKSDYFNKFAKIKFLR